LSRAFGRLWQSRRRRSGRAHREGIGSRGRGTARNLDLQPGYGTVDWLIERYYHSRAFAKVSDRTKPAYRQALGLVADTSTKIGTRFGALRLGQISAAAVDKLYTNHLLRVARPGRDKLAFASPWRPKVRPALVHATVCSPFIQVGPWHRSRPEQVRHSFHASNQGDVDLSPDRQPASGATLARPFED
jgi:hypothetical protein